MSVAEEKERDRELQNVLGQYLIASYQAEKLCEMIYEKANYTARVSKPFRIQLPKPLGADVQLELVMQLQPQVKPMSKKDLK